jgi:hypothetical protein
MMRRPAANCKEGVLNGAFCAEIFGILGIINIP